MGFTIDRADATAVLPWGRNWEEYKLMFALTAADLDKKILGVADGPASFNAEMTQAGKYCISLDPIYQFSAAQIKNRIEATAEVIVQQLEKNHDDYIWDEYGSPEKLLNIRLAAMDLFLQDFETGKKEGRYVTGTLPELAFQENLFDLVISSYCLFTYEKQFDYEFHLKAIREMARVGEEVRIFPLVRINGKPSGYLSNLMSELATGGFSTEIAPVSYQFQKGSDTMLVVKKQKF